MCVRERERERERVSVIVRCSKYKSADETYQDTNKHKNKHHKVSRPLQTHMVGIFVYTLKVKRTVACWVCVYPRQWLYGGSDLLAPKIYKPTKSAPIFVGLLYESHNCPTCAEDLLLGAEPSVW